MLVAWGEGIDPALVPALLEAVELNGEIPAPVRHVRLDFLHVRSATIADANPDNMFGAGREPRVPAPPNDPVVVGHTVGPRQGNSNTHEPGPLVGVENRDSVRL